MSKAIDSRVLLLYVVVFVGFLGYSLIIATFTPMILRNQPGPSEASAPAVPVQDADVGSGSRGLT